MLNFADQWNYCKINLKEVSSDKKKRNVNFSYAVTDNVQNHYRTCLLRFDIV
jgi:hypothetical protein